MFRMTCLPDPPVDDYCTHCQVISTKTLLASRIKL